MYLYNNLASKEKLLQAQAQLPVSEVQPQCRGGYTSEQKAMFMTEEEADSYEIPAVDIGKEGKGSSALHHKEFLDRLGRGFHEIQLLH